MSDFFAEATQSFLQPIAEYLNDVTVAEIMVNGPSQIYIEKKGKLQKTSAQFRDDDELMAAVRRIAQTVGKKIDRDSPIMDARLHDGSRVHAMIAPAARQSAYLSIRKFIQESMSLRQIVDGGALSMNMAKFLNLCVAVKKNILVSGGTSSGKTTLLNIVSSLIPATERILVIEDASELQLQQEHVLSMEAQAAGPDGQGEVSMRDLVRASLRMRPDRIVIGEVRGGEAMDLLQAMNTGHSGSMATIHANTAAGALSRLETLSMMSDVNLPLRALRNQVANAIDIVIQTARIHDGSRKVISMSEVMKLTEDGKMITKDIFVYEKGQHKATGVLPSFLKSAKAQGYKIDEILFSG